MKESATVWKSLSIKYQPHFPFFLQVENADEICGLKTKRTENLILAIYISAILFLFPVISGAAHVRTGGELRKSVAEAKRMRRRIR